MAGKEGLERRERKGGMEEEEHRRMKGGICLFGHEELPEGCGARERRRRPSSTSSAHHCVGWRPLSYGVVGLHIAEEILGGVKVTPTELCFERIVAQKVDLLMLQVAEETLDVFHVVPTERVSERIVA